MMKQMIIAAGMLAASTAIVSAATLDTVKSRGTLVCGVSAGFAGFSAPDSQGNYKGLDVDYCRALAAGIFGDPNKVRYVSLTAQNRFALIFRLGQIKTEAGRTKKIADIVAMLKRGETFHPQKAK